MRWPLAIALLFASCATPAQPETTSRPTQGVPAGKARNGGFYGLRLVEKRVDGEAVMAVAAVLDGTDAHRLGFRAGDLITGVSGVRFADGDQFIKLLYGTLPGEVGELMRGSLPEPAGEPYITVRRGGAEVRIAGGLAELDASPRVGDPAPDFTLADAQGERQVTLSGLVGEKPVVLVFGSFT